MIILTDISKSFPTGTVALSDLSLTIEKGEFVFLVGQTGSGKTTLLKLLIREMLPTKGAISVADFDLVKLPKSKIPHFRKKIGIVFQDLRLLMDRTILENVILPLEITGRKIKESVIRAEELLTQVGMIEHRDKFPIQLSGGELQRVAIARALALYPAIILADEPTGNLDSKTAFDIVELLSNINQLGTTVIMATHNLDILKKYPKNRIIELDKGKLVHDKKQEKTNLTVMSGIFKEVQHETHHKSDKESKDSKKTDSHHEKEKGGDK